MTLKLKLTPAIYMVGFMGSGKSTIGRALSEELGWSFFDLDDDIERCTGKRITAIFEEQGEAEFRKIETAALKRRIEVVGKGQPQVISLGGGVFTIPGNRVLANSNGVTLWLDAPLEEVERRVAHETHRPLARDLSKLRALFAERREAYAQADYRIDASGAPNEIVARILALPLFVP